MQQTYKILNYLKQGNKITAIEALELFGCFRLASRINDMKKLGVVPYRRMIDLPNGKHVMQYWL